MAVWGERGKTGINNSIQLYSTFLGTQSALHRRGESPHPPPMCSLGFLMTTESQDLGLMSHLKDGMTEHTLDRL